MESHTKIYGRKYGSVSDPDPQKSAVSPFEFRKLEISGLWAVRIPTLSSKIFDPKIWVLFKEVEASS
jgi:hypothetical protein